MLYNGHGWTNDDRFVGDKMMTVTATAAVEQLWLWLSLLSLSLSLLFVPTESIDEHNVTTISRMITI
jgi:hypothetical protein